MDPLLPKLDKRLADVEKRLAAIEKKLADAAYAKELKQLQKQSHAIIAEQHAMAKQLAEETAKIAQATILEDRLKRLEAEVRRR